MLNILTLIPALMGILGKLPMVIQVIEALIKAVIDAESTALSGPDKMTAVLNDVEAAINDINPAWTQPFDTIAKDVESAVEEVVTLFNSFKKAVPTPVG